MLNGEDNHCLQAEPLQSKILLPTAAVGIIDISEDGKAEEVVEAEAAVEDAVKAEVVEGAVEGEVKTDVFYGQDYKKGYGSKFTHDMEKAEPGYYAVYLGDSEIFSL